MNHSASDCLIQVVLVLSALAAIAETCGFQCADGGCIHVMGICDGVKHCADNSNNNYLEPSFCRDFKCDSWEWKCNNGICIDKSDKCDYWDHCGDGSDEIDDWGNKCERTDMVGLMIGVMIPVMLIMFALPIIIICVRRNRMNRLRRDTRGVPQGSGGNAMLPVMTGPQIQTTFVPPPQHGPYSDGGFHPQPTAPQPGPYGAQPSPYGVAQPGPYGAPYNPPAAPDSKSGDLPPPYDQALHMQKH